MKSATYARAVARYVDGASDVADYVVHTRRLVDTLPGEQKIDEKIMARLRD